VTARFEVATPGGALAGFRTGRGRPALLVHGGPLSCDYLEPLTEELSASLECIVYQQRSLPPSPVGGPYSVAGHVADALAVLAAVTSEKAWVIGHSWGGFLAMAIVAAAPERVIGYVPIEATVPAGDAGLSAFGRWLQRILSEEERREIARIEARPAADAPVALADSAMSVYWRAYFADPGSAPPLPDLLVNLVCARQSLADMVRVSQAGELAATLRTLDIPALFIEGSESSLRAPGEEFARTLPRAAVAVVENAGHFPWFEAPGRVGEFVSSVTR
jgi:proline iminopeptidase